MAVVPSKAIKRRQKLLNILDSFRNRNKLGHPLTIRGQTTSLQAVKNLILGLNLESYFVLCRHPWHFIHLTFVELQKFFGQT